MSAVEKLIAAQEKNKSYICLGLDLDPKKMPPDSALSIKGMYEFAMNIVEATKDHVCAYKPNLAFYEHLGHDGMSLLETIVKRMPKDIPIILDCKRGDIGNTASFYAEAMFEKMNADWVTLSPYMGYDSMRPFLEYKDKGIFVLCLTSNSGSKDFQLLDVGGKPLYEIVAEKVDYWNKENNCGLVVGATNPEQLKDLRVIAKEMPMLIPGVGAQGGSLEKSLLYGTDNFTKPAVINVSRSVLYASNGADYAEKAQAELIRLNRDSQKIKAGEYTETPKPVSQETAKEEPVKVEPTQQEPAQQEAPKTQVQGFTPPPVQEQPKQPEQETQPIKAEPIVPPKLVVPTPPPVSSPAPVQEQQKQPEQETQPIKAEPIVPPKIVPPPIPTPQPPVQETVKPAEHETQPIKAETHESAKPVDAPKPAEPGKPAEPAKAVEQSEPKKTPPPLPTPPPILAPNPEVMRRNREEQERRLKALQEQKQKQQNGDSNLSDTPTENSESTQQADSNQQENSSQQNNDSSQNGNHQQNNHKNNFQSRRHNRNNR